MKIRTIALFCFAALFVPNLVHAQQLGCYVDFRTPNTCFEGLISCALTNVLTDEVALHGTATGYLCYKYGVTINSLLTCESSYSDMTANRDQWVTYSNSQTKLIKKLRKACGTKCKKIK